MLMANLANRMIVTDIVKALTLSQKARDTLLEDCLSEQCFNFFREAMHVAGKLINADVAFQINDLLENDPNANILLGGNYNSQRYYLCFMQILLRKTPLDEATKHFYIYIPHIWTANTQFYHEFIEKISQEGAGHLIPRVWTDLEENQFLR